MIFEFMCTVCFSMFDVTAPIGTSPEMPVCKCGGVVRRMYAPPGVTYHGSGFYSTDKVLSEPEKD